MSILELSGTKGHHICETYRRDFPDIGRKERSCIRVCYHDSECTDNFEEGIEINVHKRSLTIPIGKPFCEDVFAFLGSCAYGYIKAIKEYNQNCTSHHLISIHPMFTENLKERNKAF